MLLRLRNFGKAGRKDAVEFKVFREVIDERQNDVAEEQQPFALAGDVYKRQVFDGELDAADVFVSLIAQKYGQNTGKENLVKTQDLGYNKDEVQKLSLIHI